MATIKHVEIAGVNGAKLKSFYSGLFGWTIKRRDIAGFDYYDAVDHESPTMGIRHEPEGTPEIVLYIEVQDLSLIHPPFSTGLNPSQPCLRKQCQ